MSETLCRPGPAGMVLIYSAFFLSGVVTVLLGPVIPLLTTELALPIAQLGALFLAQFVSSSLGAVLASWHLRFSMLAGLAAMAAGLLAFAQLNWPAMLAGAGLFGIGLGFLIPSTNLLVAQLKRQNRASSLNLLNLIWGLGAVCCPLIIGALVPAVGLRTTLASLGALAGGLAFLLACMALPGRQAPAAGPALVAGPHSATWGFVALCAILFLYIGCENSIAGWAGSYAKELAAGNETASTVVVFCFWTALLGGRAFAVYAARHRSESVLWWSSLAAAGLGILLVLQSSSLVILATGAAVAGFGLAPIFALTVSLMSAHADIHGRGVPGWAFAVAGTGGGALPWVAGQVASSLGSVQFAFLVPLVGLASLAGLALLYHRAFSSRLAAEDRATAAAG